MPRNATPIRYHLLAVLLVLASHHALANLLPAVDSLVAAYPRHFTYDAADNTIVWSDGSRIPFGAERPGLTFDQRIASATLFDQLLVPYPREWPTSPPATDPGRLRCEAFFKTMYGGTRADVERNLALVPWPAGKNTRTVSFTTINGADKALKSVGEDIAKLPKEVQRYAARPAGTFNWRTIDGTTRLSPHSFGIAIDFDLPNVANQYWRWPATDGQHATRAGEARNPRTATARGEAPAGPDAHSSYPTAVLDDDALRQFVETFERHSFIWGGKWRHYDLMHFEYRPELVPPQH